MPGIEFHEKQRSWTNARNPLRETRAPTTSITNEDPPDAWGAAPIRSTGYRAHIVVTDLQERQGFAFGEKAPERRILGRALDALPSGGVLDPAEHDIDGQEDQQRDSQQRDERAHHDRRRPYGQ
ncbi:hypothetical protein GCM10022226_06120 [Sphaerisporangium flaviroseum]|uniref:Uncharacterized protein n=1 Tax=Sphaerisporangium flaviroseum TaxID=509199 RepID=A0ABP7HIT3_9ACTN